MTEKLLQYIWQFQLFNKRQLFSTDGISLIIQHPGFWNRDQGPDFKNGRMEYEGISWVGNIELHINSSDWLLHRHQFDPQYANVILHVVWIHDKSIGISFPTLELQPLVSNILLNKYQAIMQKSSFIPCETQFSDIPKIIINKMIETMTCERIQMKSNEFLSDLKSNGMNWEETTWQWLAGAFGGRVNRTEFIQLARQVPLAFLQKIKHDPLMPEAVLLGQGGLLPSSSDEPYIQDLIDRYRAAVRKGNLPQPIVFLQFLRMRPTSFPTIRLAQLAAYSLNAHSLFSDIIDLDEIHQKQKLFQIQLPSFWECHYTLEKKGAAIYKKIGAAQVKNYFINVSAIVNFAYGDYYNLPERKEKTIQWLIDLPPEKNKWVDKFNQLGFKSSNAFESQGILQLKNRYCDQKKCLQCMIGTHIFRKSMNLKNDSKINQHQIH